MGFTGVMCKNFETRLYNCLRYVFISICLDLSASFVMFRSWNSYVLVIKLLMIGYSLKCTYRVPKYPYLFKMGNLVFRIHWVDASACGPCPRGFVRLVLNEICQTMFNRNCCICLHS